MRRWSLVPIVLTALLAPLADAAPAAAETQTETSVTMVGERGEYVGLGRDRLFAAHNATIAVSGGPVAISVDVSGGPYDESYSIDLRTGDGRPFEPRTYVDQQVTLSAHGEGRACNAARRRVTVLDIAYTGSAVERFHAVYEQRCNGIDDAALFGEIRYQVPGGDSDLLVAPAVAAWPDTYPGADARPVPVTFVNTGAGPVTLDEPEITGASAAAFSVGDSTCTSAALAPGEACVVQVGFRPGAGAPHDAVLTVADSTAAGSRSVRLSGAGQAGTTSLQVRSDPEDPIGAGRSFDWSPRSASLSAQGTEVLLRVVGDSGDDRFEAAFEPPRNDVLVAGRTYVQSRSHPYGLDQPRISIALGEEGCTTAAGRFTVHEIAVGPYGLERLSLTFQLGCTSDGPAILGSVAYRSAHPAQPVPERTPDEAPPAHFTDIAGTPHERSILVVADRGIAAGYADGTFRPLGAVTRGQLAGFLTKALDLPRAPSAGFSDTGNSVFAAAIDAVAAAGIAGGYGDGSYRPAELVTRGQLATFLTRALDLPAGGSAGFSDTTDDAHAAGIDAVAAAGIAGGFGDGTYRPRDSVTRGQLATFLVRGLGLTA